MIVCGEYLEKKLGEDPEPVSMAMRGIAESSDLDELAAVYRLHVLISSLP